MILWKYYFNNIDCTIVVLDSSNTESIKESVDIFWDYFAKNDNNFPVLIFVNRLNLEGALSIDNICSIFNLKNLDEKLWKIIGSDK